MGIRQTINEKPQITMGVTGAIILIALIYIAVHAFGGGPAAHAVKPLAFFSDDDGQTYFVDDGAKIPPFDHNGKQAFKAMVYRCEGGKPFVAYLQRCNDEQRRSSRRPPRRGTRRPSVTCWRFPFRWNQRSRGRRTGSALTGRAATLSTSG